MLGDRTRPPRLAHADNNTDNAKDKRNRSGDSHGEFGGVIIVLWTIPIESTSENKVVNERNAGVNSQPVGDKAHEILEDGLKVVVTGDTDGKGDARGEESPDEPRHALRSPAQHLQRQADRVDVGAVVGDNGQGQDDEAELAETAERLKHGCDQAAVDGGSVAFGVLVVNSVAHLRRGHDGDAKELSEEQGNNQTKPCRKEDQTTALGLWLVDGVVGGVAGPAGCETIDSRSEG